MKKIALKVFITGASSGIGEALAKEYASQGALLGLVARRGELLEKLAAEIQTKFAKLDSKVRLYVADVRDEQALQLAVQQFIKEFGSPDIVIASAGVSIGTLTQYAEDIESFKAVMDINVVGVV
ncbi:MAG: SDR family NAD(P)-dependent oxidoreductase, partial [Methylophilaceae bacterium]|nr:SDR family NAD(P)-dependent oxidoreductase [Methylophilaceae bacterium]